MQNLLSDREKTLREHEALISKLSAKAERSSDEMTVIKETLQVKHHSNFNIRKYHFSVNCTYVLTIALSNRRRSNSVMRGYMCVAQVALYD